MERFGFLTDIYIDMWCTTYQCSVTQLQKVHQSHQSSPSKSINIIQQTTPSLSLFRSKRPITTIDIEGIYRTNILQTGLAEGETVRSKTMLLEGHKNVIE